MTALLATNAQAANIDIVSAPQGWRLTVAQDYCSATVEYENGATIGLKVSKAVSLGIAIDLRKFRHAADITDTSIDFDGRGTVYAMKYLPNENKWALKDAPQSFIDSLMNANVLNYREDDHVTPYSLAGSAAAIAKALDCAKGKTTSMDSLPQAERTDIISQKPASHCIALLRKEVRGPWVNKDSETMSAVIGTGWNNALHSCIVSTLLVQKLPGFADARMYVYLVHTVPENVPVVGYKGMVVTTADGRKQTMGSVCTFGVNAPAVEGCSMDEAVAKARSYFSNYLTLGGTPESMRP
jgi:hypothetical protein